MRERGEERAGASQHRPRKKQKARERVSTTSVTARVRKHAFCARVTVMFTLLRLSIHPQARCPTAARSLNHVFSKHLSTRPSATPASALLSSTILAGLGGSAIVASYFLWPDASNATPTMLSSSRFMPVTITSTEPCTDPNTRLITLRAPRQSIPTPQGGPFDPIYAIFVKDDDLQVERPFTPLEGIDSEGRMKFWIKKYDHSEVGRWLHSKMSGDAIEIRGPVKTWAWQENKWDDVIMVRVL